MRRTDWVEHLHAAVEAWRHEPFAWGRHDCCLFTARCVDAMCGTDFESALSEKYSDERTALAYIATYGDLRSAVCEWLGDTVARPALLRRGDVVLFRDDTGADTLGVCLGPTIATTVRGGDSVPMSRAVTGWRID